MGKLVSEIFTAAVPFGLRRAAAFFKNSLDDEIDAGRMSRRRFIFCMEIHLINPFEKVFKIVII